MKRARKNVTGQVFLPIPPVSEITLAWLGGCLGIAAVAALSRFSGQTWILGSFGASCVLQFGFPDAPFSQLRNVILGHMLCSIIGLGFLTFVGSNWWSMALTVGAGLNAVDLRKIRQARIR